MRRRSIGGSVWQRRARTALARKYRATVRWKDELAAALQGAKEELGRVVAEREPIEAALRESEQRFAILCETTFEGIGLSDDGHVLAVNDQLAGMLGYAPGELIGTDELEFVASEARDLVLKHMRAGYELPYEHLALRKDGSVFPVEVRARTVPYQGRAIRVAAIRDIAALRQSEAALRRIAARMEGLHEIDRAILSARSPEAIALAALGQVRQLVPSIRASVAIFDQPDQQARILAVSAGDATYLTPDQRTPLEHFGDLADLRRGQPSRADDLAALAERSQLARDLLADGVLAALVMPMIANGELIGALNLEAGSVGAFAAEDIELVMLTAPDLGLIKADPGQIEQVLVNLAVNARHAMPAGGKLTIETRNLMLDEDQALQHIGVTLGLYILLAISDTGMGMDHETQEHLFEPFFTTKGPGRGTGLGLATCYGIIKQHGGHISAYSELGHGTTFKILLPCTSGPAMPVPLRDDTGALPQGDELVLLAEDEPAVRAMAARVLRQQGYHVLEAANGEEALQIARQRSEPIALLLTDMVMPRMGGKPLAEQIAQLRPAIRVLFISGYTDAAFIQHSQAQPGSAFLQKPFSPATLARKVREVLDA